MNDCDILQIKKFQGIDKRVLLIYSSVLMHSFLWLKISFEKIKREKDLKMIQWKKQAIGDGRFNILPPCRDTVLITIKLKFHF